LRAVLEANGAIQSADEEALCYMMAKVTDHLWSFDEFYETVIQYN
jgi:hypothetical protein